MTTWYGSHSSRRFGQSQFHFLRRPSQHEQRALQPTSSAHMQVQPPYSPHDTKTASPLSPPHAACTSPRSPHDARSRGAQCARTPTPQHRSPVRLHPSARAASHHALRPGT
ncbi:hypothetical protein BD779DRAFT_1569758 [Infundibulicybe gibba]|nr:hypothetical protein BD779DRAFT_1569758 [Infundibulicybe gibba]